MESFLPGLVVDGVDPDLRFPFLLVDILTGESWHFNFTHGKNLKLMLSRGGCGKNCLEISLTGTETSVPVENCEARGPEEEEVRRRKHERPVQKTCFHMFFVFLDALFFHL